MCRTSGRSSSHISCTPLRKSLPSGETAGLSYFLFVGTRRVFVGTLCLQRVEGDSQWWEVVCRDSIDKCMCTCWALRTAGPVDCCFMLPQAWPALARSPAYVRSVARRMCCAVLRAWGL